MEWKDREPVTVFFNCLHQIAWELIGLDKEVEPNTMGTYSLLAKDLPVSFIQKQTSRDIVSLTMLLELYDSSVSDNPELEASARVKAKAASPRVPEQGPVKGEVTAGRQSKWLLAP